MKLVVGTDNRFWRESIGSQKRIASLLRHLVEAGCEIHVVFVGGLTEDDVRLASERFPRVRLRPTSCDIVKPAPELADGRGRSVAFGRVLKRFVKHTLHVARRRIRYAALPAGRTRCHSRASFGLAVSEPKLAELERPEARRLFAAVVASVVPDAVLIEYVHLAYLLDGLDEVQKRRVRKLIDTHDVMYERRLRFHRNGQAHTFDITPEEEAAILERFDVVLAIQATDGEKLRALVPGKNVVVVPHPNPIDPLPVCSQGNAVIAFIGSDMKPNVDAARLLIDTVLPDLRAQLGDGVELRIAGSVCGQLGAACTVEGVKLLGVVSDPKSLYREATVIVNPVSYGGGLKIKNVEALCHGLPLVTTVVGSEGMEDGAGHAFLVARDSRDFTEKVLQLLRDVEMRKRLGRNALSYAMSRFAPDVAYRALDAALDLAAEQAMPAAVTGVRAVAA